MGRAPCCDRTAVKRGPWSPEEDALLRSFVECHGTGGNWIALPRKAGLNRCGKSCRLRWLNYLRPDIRHGGFTQEEDYIICTLFSAIGSRWSFIASELPGRTDNDVKNYWNTKLKKKFIMAADKVPSFEAGSVPNYPQSVQSNPMQLTQMKQEHETSAYDHIIYNNDASNYSMPSSSLVAMKPWEESSDPVEIFHGVSEVPSSSRCSSIGGGGGEVVEDDIDDFWLRVLVDQSTVFGGSSQVAHHEMINGFESVFDSPIFPSFS